MAKTSAWTAQSVGLLIVLILATFTIMSRHQIAMLYNKDPEVVALASYLMLLASIFQFSDSIQMIGGGILRGYKDTRPIFFITFLSYWMIGLPIGYILSLTDFICSPMGPAGFWYGFIIGLTCAAIMMVWRIIYIQHQSETIILKKAAG